jgi:hypothetical protein
VWFAICAGLLGFVLHLPFVARYDLHFQPDFAISLLMSRSILHGEHPVFFWGQNYLGTYGNYLTALLFALFGVSIEIACLVSLAIWAVGVGVTALLARRFLDRRAARWTAAAAALSSPYATHYVTQPYSSFETAPVLGVLCIAAIPIVARLLRTPIGLRAGLRWLLLGMVVGAALWTTRLFVPILASVVLAAVVRAEWKPASRRRAAVACVLVALGLLAGASPEIAFRLQRDRAQPIGERSLFDTASFADMPRRAWLGLESLPAYFNGDPVARHPEGVTFSLALWDGRAPYGGDENRPGPLARANDLAVRVALVGILAAALVSAVRAWRQRHAALLAVCLVPVVHLLLIAMSLQTTHYFAARRYWFASLLVLALLVGNAVMVAERSSWRGVRSLAPIVAAMFLISSLVSQVQLLRLPDELADYRVVTRQLEDEGPRAAIMPDAGWIVAGLGLGAVDVFDNECLRRPPMCARVVASERVALVLRRHRPLPDRFTLRTVPFTATVDPPHDAGDLHWRTYRR